MARASERNVYIQNMVHTCVCVRAYSDKTGMIERGPPRLVATRVLAIYICIVRVSVKDILVGRVYSFVYMVIMMMYKEHAPV